MDAADVSDGGGSACVAVMVAAAVQTEDPRRVGERLLDLKLVTLQAIENKLQCTNKDTCNINMSKCSAVTVGAITVSGRQTH